MVDCAEQGQTALIIDGTLSWVVNGYFAWVIWTWAELEADEGYKAV